MLEMSKLGEIGDQMGLQNVWGVGRIEEVQRGDRGECLGDVLDIVHAHFSQLDRQFPTSFVPTTTDQTTFVNAVVQNVGEDLQQEVLFFEQCAEVAFGHCRLHVAMRRWIDAKDGLARLKAQKVMVAKTTRNA